MIRVHSKYYNVFIFQEVVYLCFPMYSEKKRLLATII